MNAAGDISFGADVLKKGDTAIKAGNFLWIKQIEFTLGSATPQLLRIGRELADTPA